MIYFPKVLICCPTASAKEYCFASWIENVMNFTYPNFDIHLFDNTDDKGLFAEYMNNYVAEKFGNLRKFKATNSLILNNSNEKSVIAKMCISHNDCKNEFLSNNYDFMLHLESDIFPQPGIIEQLISHGKNVVGAAYYIDEGINRRPMIFDNLELAPNNIISLASNLPEEIQLLNSKLHKVAQIGLGCVLITKKVFERVKFRFVPNNPCHPDTFFSEDCHTKSIPIHVDTSCICEHDNKNWGIYGLDFN